MPRDSFNIEGVLGGIQTMLTEQGKTLVGIEERLGRLEDAQHLTRSAAGREPGRRRTRKQQSLGDLGGFKFCGDDEGGCSFNFEQKVSQMRQQLRISQRGRTGHRVVLPDSPFRVLVDIFFLLTTLAESHHTPLSLLWPDTISHNLGICLSLAYTVAHSIFMVTNSQTAVLTGYILVDSDLPTVRSAYFKGWFAFDAATSLPFDLLWRKAIFLRLFHVLRVPWLFKSANPLKQSPWWVPAVYSVFWGFWTLNLLGIIFVLIEPDATRSYADADDKDHIDHMSLYLGGYYWAAITISSVGYGDVVPTSAGARLFSIPVILFSVLLCSVLTGHVASSAIRLDAFQQQLREKKEKLYSLMNRYEVPWEVQKEAFSIYPALLETSLKDYLVILNDLPPFMQQRMMLFIKRKVVSQVPFFTDMREDVLAAVAAVTSQLLTAPNENIITAGEVGEEMYFIAQGVVEVIIPDPQIMGEELTIATLQGGSWFGEIALIKHTERTATVRSVTACSIFKLQKDDMIGIFKLFPDIEEQIRASVESRMVTSGGSFTGDDGGLPDQKGDDHDTESEYGAFHVTTTMSTLSPPKNTSFADSNKSFASGVPSVGSFTLDRVLNRGYRGNIVENPLKRKSGKIKGGRRSPEAEDVPGGSQGKGTECESPANVSLVPQGSGKYDSERTLPCEHQETPQLGEITLSGSGLFGSARENRINNSVGTTSSVPTSDPTTPRQDP